MQALPKALFLVMLELSVGSFVSLYLLDRRGDTSRGFVVFQGVLYTIFGVLTLLAMNAFAAPELVRGYGLDTAWLQAQAPLVLAFTLLMIPWNILLWSDRQQRQTRKPRPADASDAATAEQSEVERAPAAPPSGRRRARFAVGALTSLVGLAALLAVGMAYRPLADSHLGGAFVVLTFLAGGLALGGVMTAMLLGHWYLNTPTASGKPLEFVTILLVVALAAELGFTLLIGPSTAHSTLPSISTTQGVTIDPSGQVSTPTVQPGQQQSPTAVVPKQTPLGTDAMVWLQFLLGFASPLVLGAVALYLTRGRSFQSATGMLYLCVAFVFIGEVIGRGLLLFPIMN